MEKSHPHSIVITVVRYKNIFNCETHVVGVRGSIVFQPCGADSYYEAVGRFFVSNLDALADFVVDGVELLETADGKSAADILRDSEVK
jgi:hypothetical protein